MDLPWLDDVVRAKRPQRLPIVLTREEVRAALQPLEGVPRLMAHLLYGAGLRLLECCRLRVQDVDFASNQLVVRTGKGDKDRVTMLPAVVKADLARHLEGSGSSTRATFSAGRVGSTSPRRSGGSIRTRAGSGYGNGSSPRHPSMWTGTPASVAGTTCTSPFSSGS